MIALLLAASLCFLPEANPDIWIGYEAGGWAVPVDAYFTEKLEPPDINDTYFLRWTLYSPTTALYYVFIFRSNEPWGDPPGLHPCAWGAMEQPP